MAGRYGFYIILLVTGILALEGCRGNKSTAINKGPDEAEKVKNIFDMGRMKTHPFHTMKINRAEVEYTSNGVNEKVKCNIAVYRDSMIAISLIPALGYEVLRILCSKDSVILINRPDRMYSATSFENYRHKYHIPIDFYDIQAILANEIFYYKDDIGDRVFEQKMNSHNQNTLFIIDAFREGRMITSQGIEIGKIDGSLEKIFVVDYDYKIRLTLDYKDFTDKQTYLFPESIEMEVVENTNSMKLKIHYGQVVFNDSINVKFSVPEQYTKEDRLL